MASLFSSPDPASDCEERAVKAYTAFCQSNEPDKSYHLDAAVVHYRDMAHTLPKTDPRYLSTKLTLANVQLEARIKGTTPQRHFEEGVELYFNILDLCKEVDPKSENFSESLCVLGDIHYHLSRIEQDRPKKLKHLQQAFDYYQLSSNHAGSDTSSSSDIQWMLGVITCQRCELEGNDIQLDNAIKDQLSSVFSSDQSACFNYRDLLGKSLVDQLTLLIDPCPRTPQIRDLALLHLCKALLFRHKYKQNGDPFDLERAKATAQSAIPLVSLEVQRELKEVLTSIQDREGWMATAPVSAGSTRTTTTMPMNKLPTQASESSANASTNVTSTQPIQVGGPQHLAVSRFQLFGNDFKRRRKSPLSRIFTPSASDPAGDYEKRAIKAYEAFRQSNGSDKSYHLDAAVVHYREMARFLPKTDPRYVFMKFTLANAQLEARTQATSPRRHFEEATESYVEVFDVWQTVNPKPEKYFELLCTLGRVHFILCQMNKDKRKLWNLRKASYYYQLSVSYAGSYPSTFSEIRWMLGVIACQECELQRNDIQLDRAIQDQLSSVFSSQHSHSFNDRKSWRTPLSLVRELTNPIVRNLPTPRDLALLHLCKALLLRYQYKPIGDPFDLKRAEAVAKFAIPLVSPEVQRQLEFILAVAQSEARTKATTPLHHLEELADPYLEVFNVWRTIHPKPEKYFELLCALGRVHFDLSGMNQDKQKSANLRDASYYYQLSLSYAGSYNISEIQWMLGVITCQRCELEKDDTQLDRAIKDQLSSVFSFEHSDFFDDPGSWDKPLSVVAQSINPIYRNLPTHRDLALLHLCKALLFRYQYKQNGDPFDLKRAEAVAKLAIPLVSPEVQRQLKFILTVVRLEAGTTPTIPLHRFEQAADPYLEVFSVWRTINPKPEKYFELLCTLGRVYFDLSQMKQNKRKLENLQKASGYYQLSLSYAGSYTSTSSEIQWMLGVITCQRCELESNNIQLDRAIEDQLARVFSSEHSKFFDDAGSWDKPLSVVAQSTNPIDRNLTTPRDLALLHLCKALLFRYQYKQNGDPFDLKRAEAIAKFAIPLVSAEVQRSLEEIQKSILMCISDQHLSFKQMNTPITATTSSFSRGDFQGNGSRTSLPIGP